MRPEWIMVAALLAVALWPISRVKRFKGAAFLALGVAGLGLAGAYAWGTYLDRRELSRQQLFQENPPSEPQRSYVQSDHCRSCHPSEYRSWYESYHRAMTQYALPGTVRGDFDQVRLEWDGDEYLLERRGDEFWVEMPDPNVKLVEAERLRAFLEGRSQVRPPAESRAPRVWKRVGTLTGSHHMQAYWVPGRNGNELIMFPFTYLFEDQRWVPRPDVFLRDPNQPRKWMRWNQNCIKCHTTAGQPGRDPQSGAPHSRVVEMGIACEACHGPAEEHVQANFNPVRRFLARSAEQPDPTIANPARMDHRRSSEVCGQCHAVRFNADPKWPQYGWNYRPGDNLEREQPLARRANMTNLSPDHPFKEEITHLWEGSFWPDGMIRVSGREFNGLVETPCFQRGEMSCLSCHSMHDSDPNDQLIRGMTGNQACLQCHQTMAEDIPAHTRHAAGSSGSQCYNCHMPHTTYGLLTAMRSHQVDSPSVQVNLATGRPNACNLCHLDRSLGWTAFHLHEWYDIPEPELDEVQQTESAAVQWILSGDAGLRALVAWHMGWAPAVETSGPGWIPAYLARTLEDPYSAVRYIAWHALKSFPGYAALDFDYIGSKEHLAQMHREAMDIWQSGPERSFERHAQVLLQADGKTLDNERITELLGRRDNRSMDLLE